MKGSRRAALSLLLMSWCLIGQSDTGSEEWTTFIAWMKALPPGVLPSGRLAPFDGYRKKLMAAGMPPKDVEALVARLQKRAEDNPEYTAVNLNRVYSQGGREFNHRDQPNAFLVETVGAMRPGRVLDLGMGEGRNAIYLAQRGWDVVGLDVSDVGVAHAKESAGRAGVRIDARVQDIYTFDFGTSQWDLVCLMYFPIPDTRQGLYQKIATGLKPGGYVIAEGLGAPAMETLLQARARWEATELHLLRMEYLEAMGDWGSRPGPFGRLLLQKPY